VTSHHNFYIQGEAFIHPFIHPSIHSSSIPKSRIIIMPKKATSSSLKSYAKLPLHKKVPVSKKGLIKKAAVPLSPSPKKVLGRPPRRSEAATTAATTQKKSSSSSATSFGGCTKEKLCAIIALVSKLHNGAGAPKEMVAKRSGYPNAKHQSFTKALSRQSKNGFLTVKDGTFLYLTESGKELAGQANIDDLPVDNSAQLDKIEQSLSAKQRDLFVLLRDRTEPIMKDKVAAILGYADAKVQGFSKLVSRVRAQGHLEDAPDNKHAIQLSDLCFPFGRP
jgi:hypothetical protein